MVENKKSFIKSGTTKVALIGLVSSVVGGGATVGGAYYLNTQTNFLSSSSTTTTASKNGVKVSNSKVSGTSDATKAFNTVSGAVVSVINLQKSSGLSAYTTGSSNSDSDLQTAAEGSGVIYKKADGKAYIVTNNHVVSGSSALQIIMSDGTKLDAKLVGTDEYTDLAVLSIDADKVASVADFADSDDIEPGQSVLAIGSPLGTDYATSVTEGIVSAKNRTVDATDEDGNSLGKETVIQTDAAINQGNSGGPLVNLAGQVIGINSMKLTSSTDGTSVEGMGFAIPSNSVVKIINQLEKDGKITRPGLGVSMLDLSSVSTSEAKSVLKLSSDVSDGVVVMSVVDGSPADEAGLKKYDVITKIGDTTVKDSAELRSALYSYTIGDSVKVTYYHEGKEETATVKLTKTTSEVNADSTN
jgi:serine protease Do